MVPDPPLTQEFRPCIQYADILDYKLWKTPRRIITDYMLLYIQKGTIKLTIEENAFVVTPDTFLFVQPGVVHQIESLSAVSVMALHVDLFPAAGNDYLPMVLTVDEGQSPPVEHLQPSFAAFAGVSVPVLLQPSKPDWMKETLGSLIELWSRKTAIDLLQAHLHAAELFIELIKDTTSPGSGERKSLTDLSWVPAYMQYRLAETLSVEEMARKAYMSRSYFSLLFRTQFGAAPHQYLLRLRLDTAADLLRGTALPLQEIADSCGFSSVHHFSKMFKLRFGFPPSQLRKTTQDKTF